MRPVRPSSPVRGAFDRVLTQIQEMSHVDQSVAGEKDPLAIADELDAAE